MTKFAIRVTDNSDRQAVHPFEDFKKCFSGCFDVPDEFFFKRLEDAKMGYTWYDEESNTSYRKVEDPTPAPPRETSIQTLIGLIKTTSLSLPSKTELYGLAGLENPDTALIGDFGNDDDGGQLVIDGDVIAILYNDTTEESWKITKQ